MSVVRTSGLDLSVVVPKARRDGEKVLRRLSEELSRWADRLHDEEQQK